MRDDYAREVLNAGKAMGISPRGIVIAFATVFVESNWIMYANNADPESLNFPHEALSYDANSVGLFQQRAEWWGTCADRMSPYRSALMFFDALQLYDYNNLANSPGFYAQKVQGSAFPDRYDQHIEEAQALYDRLVGQAPRSEGAVEKVLNYDRSIVGQETGYWCGPAATQIVLNSRGKNFREADLANRLGTHTGGTDHVGLIEKVLDQIVPEANYKTVWMPNDPPTRDQKERLWRDLKRSIDAGWGVVANFVAPPRNYPRGVKGSVSPRYGGGTVYHYVALMGYDDNPANRAVWVADSGFQPQGYWISFDQCATLIPPKGYCYADLETAPAPAPPPPAQPDRLTELQARVDKLTAALTALLQILEKDHPETLRAYLQEMKG